MTSKSSSDLEFTVLNPEGIKPEIEIHALCPRLNSLIGKTVNVIDLHGGASYLMKSITVSTLDQAKSLLYSMARSNADSAAGHRSAVSISGRPFFKCFCWNFFI